MWAAPSTTTPRPSCTAPPTSRIRAARSTSRRSPTRWPGHRGGRWPDPGPVHQLPGPRRDGRGAHAEARRPDPHAAGDAQGAPPGGVRGGRGNVPVRHDGLLAGRRRPRVRAEPRGHRPHPVPPARRAAPAGPARAGRGRRLRAHRPAAAPPPSSPRARAGSSAAPPTEGWWRCSTPASPPPATAGTWCAPCRPCGARRTPRRPAPRCGSSGTGRGRPPGWPCPRTRSRQRRRRCPTRRWQPRSGPSCASCGAAPPCCSGRSPRSSSPPCSSGPNPARSSATSRRPPRQGWWVGWPTGSQWWRSSGTRWAWRSRTRRSSPSARRRSARPSATSSSRASSPPMPSWSGCGRPTSGIGWRAGWPSRPTRTAWPGTSPTAPCRSPTSCGRRTCTRPSTGSCRERLGSTPLAPLAGRALGPSPGTGATTSWSTPPSAAWPTTSTSTASSSTIGSRPRPPGGCPARWRTASSSGSSTAPAPCSTTWCTTATTTCAGSWTSGSTSWPRTCRPHPSCGPGATAWPTTSSSSPSCAHGRPGCGER